MPLGFISPVGRLFAQEINNVGLGSSDRESTVELVFHDLRVSGQAAANVVIAPLTTGRIGDESDYEEHTNNKECSC